MPSIVRWSLATMLVLGAAPALADLREDCAQDADLTLAIAACSKLSLPSQPVGDRIWALHERGLAHQQRGDYGASIADFDAALALGPAEPAALLIDRGVSHRRAGDMAAAIADYDEALLLRPNDALIFNNRAWARYTGHGDLRIALKDVERSLHLKPDDVDALDTRAHIFVALGDRAAAYADFQEATQLGGAQRVRLYEQALAAQGYDPGVADGLADGALADAIWACVAAGCRLVE